MRAHPALPDGRLSKTPRSEGSTTTKGQAWYLPALAALRCREPGHAPMTSLTAYVEQDPETQLYVAVVPGLPGAHSQAASLDELRANLEEVMGLLLEADDDGNAKTS